MQRRKSRHSSEGASSCLLGTNERTINIAYPEPITEVSETEDGPKKEMLTQKILYSNTNAHVPQVPGLGTTVDLKAVQRLQICAFNPLHLTRSRGDALARAERLDEGIVDAP
ncbi:hypothetical protein PENANT_c016G04077 [Penicillium antarcticum]|uniref:Uncharacterized protein n=1 Tax=Penicillium antarcticum TaxID=416450 RepID=A0A1V6Q3V3_9EURO|nr:uncharacterized protein N7508_001204 [Penicillium antarcticum]KAJ5316696.1 hypothetical protein N7508_001204 [Penicillium antarcticum]OQD83562.1 hypothetical protein PENANT_c016G04077 [Penicillium antarcticum]